ncbi:hypothetical protein SLEP1_g40075 [Rubroshorea leprosula]|uniref:Uncharacterized protein n=1 Tax=Rubroshorea leprosula TaxID=152421 RepID=A0AAV5L2P1_9ROSI|nr:hypothetical protein SLEP1_g40075 [Rubroshorea leprosula]
MTEKMLGILRIGLQNQQFIHLDLSLIDNHYLVRPLVLVLT